MKTIIAETDMNMIKNLANKYNISVKELGKIIASENNLDQKKQVRFTNREYEILKNAAEKRDMKVSVFLRYCLKYACDNNILEKMSIKDLTSLTKRDSNELREKRVPVAFDNGEYFLEIQKEARRLEIPYTNIARWLILKSIELDVV